MPESEEDSISAQPEETATAEGSAALALRLLLPIFLLLVGAAGYFHFAKEPTAPAAVPPTSEPIEVRAIPLSRVDYQIHVSTQGIVQAHSEVALTAQVSGRVESIGAKFEVGAFFDEGDVLVELDPADFHEALVNAEAQVAQAAFNLVQEQVKADQAVLNWKDLGYAEEPSDLVLRLPHVEVAERQLELAKAQLVSAERNLSRTKVRAPFDGRVLTRSAGLGQTVNGTTALGIIIATDFSEVRLPISTRFLEELSLPEDIGDPPVEIELHDGLALDTGPRWQAQILRTEGALDSSTLELFAVARIQDPFGLKSDKVPLRVGQPVSAEIPGRILSDVFVIPREAVSGLNRIRLIDPESLTLGTAIIKQSWADDQHLVFSDPEIEDGTLLSMTRLVYAPDGGAVTIEQDVSETGDADGTDTDPGGPETADPAGEKP